MQKQLSRRHHFVPQFYLRAWYDDDDAGFWLYYRNKTGHIVLRRKPAKSVAYLNDLYSLKPEGPLPNLDKTSDELEQRFFSRIDAAAAHIHQKLLSSGINALTVTDRRVWSLFLNSLIERSPKRIADIERAINSDKIIADLKQLRLSSHMQDFLNSIDIGAVVRNNLLSALVTCIADEPFIDYLSQLCWNTVDLPKEDHFLTGDYPVVINTGQSDSPIYLLSIALSPKRLLIIHKDDPVFDLDFIRTTAIMHSIQVTEQTEKHLISSRELIDGPYIKYAKVVNQKLTPNNT
jgi:hypothetical protein